MEFSHQIGQSTHKVGNGNEKMLGHRLSPVDQDNCTLPTPAIVTLARSRHT